MASATNSAAVVAASCTTGVEAVPSTSAPAPRHTRVTRPAKVDSNDDAAERAAREIGRSHEGRDTRSRLGGLARRVVELLTSGDAARDESSRALERRLGVRLGRSRLLESSVCLAEDVARVGVVHCRDDIALTNDLALAHGDLREASGDLRSDRQVGPRRGLDTSA